MNSFLHYKLLHWGGYVVTVGNLTAIALLLLFVWLVLALVRRVLDSGVKKGRWDKGRRHSMYLIVQYVAWLLGGMGVLRLLDINISVLLAGSAAVLVGISLGLQQIFRDIASGIFILFEGTIEIGDVLLVDGVLGRVIEINLRTSKMRTPDGMIVIVPNNKFIIEKVNNLTHQDRTPSRFTVTVQVTHSNHENTVARLLLDCALAHPDVVRDDDKRKPAVRLTDFNKTDLTFELQFWTLRKFEVEVVRSDLRFAIRERFRLEGILTGDVPAPAPPAPTPAPPPQEDAE